VPVPFGARVAMAPFDYKSTQSALAHRAPDSDDRGPSAPFTFRKTFYDGQR
jgi:hypothetical protein